MPTNGPAEPQPQTEFLPFNRDGGARTTED